MGPWRSGKKLLGMVLALAVVAGAALVLPTGLAERLISQSCRICHQQMLKWLQVLGCAEPPHIDQRVGHQFHPVVSTLEVLKTQQQPLEFVLPCERPLDALP